MEYNRTGILIEATCIYCGLTRNLSLVSSLRCVVVALSDNRGKRAPPTLNRSRDGRLCKSTASEVGCNACSECGKAPTFSRRCIAGRNRPSALHTGEIGLANQTRFPFTDHVRMFVRLLHTATTKTAGVLQEIQTHSKNFNKKYQITVEIYAESRNTRNNG